MIYVTGDTHGDIERFKSSGIHKVKKGDSIIVCGDFGFVWDGSNPALGVAGSGDVLSGIIGAFLAHGEKPLSAAMNGVILHQTSGRKAAEALGYFTSEDLIEEVGRNR